jgi:hypothetical protein
MGGLSCLCSVWVDVDRSDGVEVVSGASAGVLQ